MELTLPDAIKAEATARAAWMRARGTPAASHRIWHKYRLAKATLAAMQTKRATDATAAHQPEVIGGPRND